MENGKSNCYFQHSAEKEYNQKVHLFKENMQSKFLQAVFSKLTRQNEVPAFSCICNQVTLL